MVVVTNSDVFFDQLDEIDSITADQVDSIRSSVEQRVIDELRGVRTRHPN